VCEFFEEDNNGRMHVLHHCDKDVVLKMTSLLVRLMQGAIQSNFPTSLKREMEVPDNANLIMPRLWLGNARASMDDQFMKQNNITVVFNCTKDIPFHRSIRRCYRVPVDDNLEEEEIRNMELWSFEIVAKLAREYNSGHTILVHCAAGRQRSAAVVAMYLIATSRMTTEKAIDYIQKKRPIAFTPEANFHASIEGFERSLQEKL
jgi:hypothetical protein